MGSAASDPNNFSFVQMMINQAQAVGSWTRNLMMPITLFFSGTLRSCLSIHCGDRVGKNVEIFPELTNGQN